MPKSLLSPLLLLTLTITACGGEAPPEEPVAELAGHWELVSALRNRVPTTTLNDLYFTFDGRGELRTNLLGEDQTGTYTRQNDGSIETAGVVLPLTYEVRALTESVLQLRTRHQGYLFDLELRRVADRPELPQEESM